MRRVLYASFLAVWMLVPGGMVDGAIAVSNLNTGEELRYPLPILRGTLSDAEAKEMRVVNLSSKQADRDVSGVANKGRFIALVRLVPGRNVLELSCGAEKTTFSLSYKPQTNPNIVRVFLAVDDSGETSYQTLLKDDSQDYRGKLATAMEMIQAVEAEWMLEQGFGRKTFCLERDESGAVIVRILKMEKPREFYYEMKDLDWYYRVQREMRAAFPHRSAKNVVIPAYTRFDAEKKKVFAHTALGGGDLALFGGGTLYTWPDSPQDIFRAFSDARKVDTSKVHDDSNGRRTFWGTASTTIGALAHELGHAFGLPHTNDGRGVMSRGFDYFNRCFTFVEPPSRRRFLPKEIAPDSSTHFAPNNGGFLKTSRYFALDKREYPRRSTLRIAGEKASEVVVESSQGVSYVGFLVKGNVVDYDTFDESLDSSKRIAYSLKDLQTRLKTKEFKIRVADAMGFTRELDAARLLP